MNDERINKSSQGTAKPARKRCIKAVEKERLPNSKHKLSVREMDRVRAPERIQDV